MRSFLSLFTSLVALAGIASATHGSGLQVARDHGSRSLKNRQSEPGLTLGKRQGEGSFTWYEAGLGACGGYNSDSDFIVALTTLMWDGGAHCGAAITITVNGISTGATIVDECMGCGYDDLDFSPALFQFFADLGAGEISGSWVYGSGYTPPPPATSTWEAPTPTAPAWTASTTTTTTWTTTTTTTWTTSTTSWTTTTPTSSAPTSSSSSSPAPQVVGNLELFQKAMAGFGGIVMES